MTQFNDPDFDQPKGIPENTGKRSILEQLPPKTLFIGGLVMGVMILCTIGFLILLSLFLKGGVSVKAVGVNSGSAPSVAGAVPSQPTAQAPTGTVPPVTSADRRRTKISVGSFSPQLAASTVVHRL